MPQSLKVVFHGVNRSEALENSVAEKLEALRRFDNQLGACAVTVTQEGHQTMSEFKVKASIKCSSGRDIVVERSAVDALKAVHDVFDTLRHEVQDEHDKKKRH